MTRSTVVPAIMLAAAAVAFAGGGTAFAALQGNGASIIGLWSTGAQGGRVELYRCGATICGKVEVKGCKAAKWTASHGHLVTRSRCAAGSHGHAAGRQKRRRPGTGTAGAAIARK